MRQCKAIRIGILLFGLVPAAFGCKAGKNQVSHPKAVELSAEPVSEGILLTFSAIPSDAARLFINVSNKIADSESAGFTPYDVVASYSDLSGSSFEQVKRTNKVMVPIVQKGQTYTIGIVFQNTYSEDITDWIYKDCTADNGIYFDNDVKLNLNDTHSAVVLFSEPLFSSEVTFNSPKYSYAVIIGNGLSVEDYYFPDGLSPDGLTWEFEPYLTEALREGDYLEPGSYDAFGAVYCNIVHDNIKWCIEVTKTQEFIYSL